MKAGAMPQPLMTKAPDKMPGAFKRSMIFLDLGNIASCLGD
jgi:hypothetical protein